MKGALLFALVFVGCSPRPDIALAIRLPDDRHLLAAISTLDLRAERDQRVLADSTFAASATYLSLSGITRGAGTVVRLDGLASAGDVLATGASCPFDFAAPGVTAAIYFAPTNFFASTVGAPATARDDPVAFTLPDDSVVIAGGLDLSTSTALGSVERYRPATSRFEPVTATLNVPREDAQLVPIPGVGALVVGGRDAGGGPIKTAEVYVDGAGSFAAFDNDTLGARSQHRACTLADGRVLVTGGVASPGGAPLSSTALVRVQADGSASVVAGPALNLARASHAVVVAVGVAMVIGGYGPDGQPTATAEVLASDARGQPSQWTSIPGLQEARAEATATLLGDGSILVVGGTADSQKTPRADAEVYNPITRTTTLFPLGTARRRHTATLLPDGRVLVVGGIGASNQELDSVELFVPGIGFVSERPLHTARDSHVAVPLCDGTVLVVGGAAGAELYTPAPPLAGSG